MKLGIAYAIYDENSYVSAVGRRFVKVITSENVPEIARIFPEVEIGRRDSRDGWKDEVAFV